MRILAFLLRSLLAVVTLFAVAVFLAICEFGQLSFWIKSLR